MINSTINEKQHQQADDWDDIGDISVEEEEEKEEPDYDNLVREYCYEYLFNGIAKPEKWPDCGFGPYQSAIVQYEQQRDKNPTMPAQKTKEIIRMDERLKHLFDDDDPVQGGDEESEGEGPELNFSLPPVNLDNSPFMLARARFLAFAKDLSPESYEWFLEGAFWWTCSAIAMRRIAVDLAEPMYTNLYVALCAQSTVWKKSTSLIPVERIFKGLGLSHILHKGLETPEAFVQQAAGNTIPRNYGELNQSEQDAVIQELSTAGLESLFIDELGQYLLGTRNINGPMGLWKRIILEWNACPEYWRKKTKGGGWEIVEKTYLSTIGCIVPDNLNEKDMEAFQKDGNMARFLAITPPDGTASEVITFKQGYIQTPPELLKAFSEWHQRLKPPVACVTDENEGCTDSKGNKKDSKYVKEWIQPLEETIIRLTGEAHQQYHNYRVAIRECIQKNKLASKFAAYYERLATDLIRMAAMAASFEGKYYIDVTHLAMAYPLIEEARKGIHRLLHQAGYREKSEPTKGGNLDSLIIQEIKKHLEKTGKKEFTLSKLFDRQKTLKKHGIVEVSARIEAWAKHGFLQKETTVPNQKNKKPVTTYRVSNWQEIMHD